MSASGTAALGGIGIWPHTPCPPFFTFCCSVAATFCPLYFWAISLYAGPTVFLSTVWHARQLCFLASASSACAGSANAAPARQDQNLHYGDRS